MSRYNRLNEYYKNKFGERVLKICVDGHFTCPNRDGTCGTGGCIFCGEAGSGEHLDSCRNISQQVESYLYSYKSKRANKFIVYFQNFSNTYDTIQNLKEKYDAALIDDRIVGLSIATRPDCIDENIVKLLASYKEKYEVLVELGLQTASDKTAKIINRGYNTSIFQVAVQLLRKYQIDIIVHIMIGLPGETKEDLLRTIQLINNHDIQGIKIHSTYVIKNTKLAKMYEEGEYVPLNLEEYIEFACCAIAHLRPDIIVHRISGDAPKELLLAPTWNLHKKWILNGIEKYLNNNDIKQGCAK